MHKKPLILACSLVSLLCASIIARAENLLEVYQAAAKSDPIVREAEMRRLAALEAKPQARGLLFPQVNVDGQWAKDKTDSTATFPQCVPDNPPAPAPCTVVPVPNKSAGDIDYWQYQARLTQSLFRWDQWQALKRADAQVAVAEATYRAAQQDLLVRVSQAYFDVLAAEDTLGAAEATLEALNRQLEQAEKRFEVGLIAVTDVQESRAAHDNAVAGVIASKRTLATAQEVLRELTGENYATLVKPAEQLPLDQPQPADEQTWVDQALQNNLDVVAARLNTEVAARDVRVAQAGHLPTVELFANHAEYDSNGSQTNNGDTFPEDTNQTRDTVGLQFTVPIFSGGTTHARVQEQVYLQRAAREKLEGSMRAAERETRDAYLGVIAERARVQALQQAVKSSQTALEATEAGFDVGTRTTVDVLVSRQRLFEAQRDYARSRYDFLINIVKLESATGGLRQENLSLINGYLTEPTTLPVVRPNPKP